MINLPARHPPAITKPGELWHLHGFNLSTVIIVRPGVDPSGKSTYRTMTGNVQYSVDVARFETVRDAACAVQAHNMVEEIIDAYAAKAASNGDAFADLVCSILEKYGRLPK